MEKEASKPKKENMMENIRMIQKWVKEYFNIMIIRFTTADGKNYKQGKMIYFKDKGAISTLTVTNIKENL